MRDFREKMAGFEFDLISGLGGENHSLTLESSVLYYKKKKTKRPPLYQKPQFVMPEKIEKFESCRWRLLKSIIVSAD